MSNNTLSYLKKRILDVFDEYYTAENGVFVTDGVRELLTKRIPDAMTSALARMYEGISHLGKARSVLGVNKPSKEYIEYTDLGDGNFKFYSEDANVVLAFECFGEGSVKLYDEDASVCFEKVYSEKKSITQKREIITLDRPCNYTVCTEGNLKIQRLAIYKYDSSRDIREYSVAALYSFVLPSDFERLISLETENGSVDTGKVFVKDGFAYIGECDCNGAEIAIAEYKRRPPVIDEASDDSLVFDMSPLELEALICLAACELCRDENAGLYSRMLYKYNDLIDGICGISTENTRRNSFYKSGCRQGW